MVGSEAEINRKTMTLPHFFFDPTFCALSSRLKYRSVSLFRHMPTYANGVAVTPQRHVKLFRNGRNQAVRIPREFELPGADAIIRKEGERLIIEPTPPKSLLALLATLAPLEEDFPPIADLPPDPVDI
jgi:antitoxin VapB